MKPKERKSKPRPPKSKKVKHPPNTCTSPLNLKKTHENLPNEILTEIFEYLTLKEKVQCGNTCRRWKGIISHSEKLWLMANLTNKIVPVSFLNHLCFRGTKYLSLQYAKLIIDEKFSDIQESKFTHLNLNDTMSIFEVSNYQDEVSDILEKLLKSCHFVEKLDISKLVLNPNSITGIVQNASTLTILNLRYCKGLTLNMVDVMFTNCQELTEVDIG